MKQFRATEPLAFVSIDILGESIRTKNVNRFILVIADRFTKLIRTILLKRITVTSVAHSFVHHLVFVYGRPKAVWSDNGSQFVSRFFTDMCRIIDTKMSTLKLAIRNITGNGSG